MEENEKKEEMKAKPEAEETAVNKGNSRSLIQHLLNYLNPFEGFDEFPFFADWNRPVASNTGEMMKTNIKETDEEYKMEIEVPGVDKKDIKVTLSDGYLTIKVNTNNEEKSEGEKGNFLIKERFVGSYRRSWYVGKELKNTDLKAKTANGVLTITFPKAEAKKAEDDGKVVTIS